MPDYDGKFERTSSGGAPPIQGPCRVRIEEEACTVLPKSGAPFSFDFGDVDNLLSGDWELTVVLYTGDRVQFRQFGSAFDGFRTAFIEAWRVRTIRCLLLEDLEEMGSFDGMAALDSAPAGPAEIILYQTNLAVLPAGGLPVQWRLADIDSLSFDAGSYSAILRNGARILTVSRLARRTDEFTSALQSALDDLRAQSIGWLRQIFPALTPGTLSRLAVAMPEGRSAAISDLARIDPTLADSLNNKFVTTSHRPYVAELGSRAITSEVQAGFKFIRADDAGPDSGAESNPDGNENASADPSADDEPPPLPLFVWFFYPLKDRSLIAWEPVTGSGRATYLFRADPAQPLSLQIAFLTRGLALVNFRREPVYLSDQSLAEQPRFHRYAIAARKLPDLRALRASFVGRALHTSLDAWKAQLDRLT